MIKKSSWIPSLFAWTLPAGLGAAFGGGLIIFLSQSLQADPVLASLPQKPAAQEYEIRKPAPHTPRGFEQTLPAPAVVPAPAPALVEPEPVPVEPVAKVAKLPPLPEIPMVWRPLVDDVAERLRMDIPDIGGLPLLHYAVLNDDAEWISSLIGKGADANEATPGGDTALCAAIRNMAAGSVRALLHGGADALQPGAERQPPMALASLRRGTDILRALAVAGADPNTRFVSPVSKEVLARVMIKDLKHSLENDRGVTPLMACAARGDVEGTTELLRLGAKTNAFTTRDKRYPINFAATQGYLFVMRIILGRQPESEPQVLVTIDLSKQRAWVTKEGQVIDSCSVSTGREGYSTPAGRYVITDKHRSWTSTLYHVAMPFFMRLNCSAIGLHSGYVTGRPASHGCIRLPYEKAKKFFGLVGVGDEVEIVH